MKDFHGIVFAYSASPELRELVSERTGASLPFCGRYRLIDFALSSLMNAGVRDVGVIMQRDYQSLLDHIGSGKVWDMSRKSGGLRILPPFGLPIHHKGDYSGTIEALNAVASYIKAIPQKYVVLMQGNVCANIDLNDAMEHHLRSGAEVTAICADHVPAYEHNRYIVGEDGLVKKLVFARNGYGEGYPSLENYIIEKDTLLEMMDSCRSENKYRFHADAVDAYLKAGGKMSVYVHKGYAAKIRTVDAYYNASRDMLSIENRRQLFPKDRPVRTRAVETVSTYYGENAVAANSLVADNCFIEGELENCIVFPDVRIAAGAKLSNCIIMSGCTIEENVQMNHVIADKHTKFSAYTTLTGSEKLPIVVPKHSDI